MTVAAGPVAGSLHEYGTTASAVTPTAKTSCAILNLTAESSGEASNGTILRLPESSPGFVSPTIELEAPGSSAAISTTSLHILSSVLLANILAFW